MKKFLLAAVCVAATAAAHADFPEHPITLIVPFAAGGPTDKVARDLAQSLGKALHASVIVDNIGGAGGTVGAARVARSPADGYTLLLHHIGMATAPSFYPRLSYKPLEDFEYLGMVNDVPMTLIARPTLPANTLPEVLKWISAQHGKVNIANAGLGSASQLCGFLLQHSTKLQMTAVPYKGTGPAMNDLMSGQVDLLCDQTTNTTGQIESKTVKAYGVTTARRLTVPALAKLPTLDESGLKGFNVTIWHALYAPKGTPKPIVDKLNAALKVALKDPDFVKRENDLGAVVVSDARVNPAEHKKFVAAEIAKWGPIIKAAGAQGE